MSSKIIKRIYAHTNKQYPFATFFINILLFVMVWNYMHAARAQIITYGAGKWHNKPHNARLYEGTQYLTSNRWYWLAIIGNKLLIFDLYVCAFLCVIQ